MWYKGVRKKLIGLKHCCICGVSYSSKNEHDPNYHITHHPHNHIVNDVLLPGDYDVFDKLIELPEYKEHLTFVGVMNYFFIREIVNKYRFTKNILDTVYNYIPYKIICCNFNGHYATPIYTYELPFYITLKISRHYRQIEQTEKKIGIELGKNKKQLMYEKLDRKNEWRWNKKQI